ncbi:MAG: alpha/beta hydrolase [Christensenellales bacterium]|jgi:carboxylesterase
MPVGKNNREKTAILLVHGHMGSPRQFRELLPLLPVGADTVCLTLPGHAADVAAFRTSDRSQWQRAVMETVETLRSEYDRLLLVGHSMGGLLLTLEAIRDPGKILGIVALALPLGIRLTRRGIGIRLAALHPPREDEDPDVTAARNLCGISGLIPRHIPGLLPNTLGLMALIRETNRRLPGLNVPMLALQGRRDEIVSPAAVRRACGKNPRITLEMLEGTSHFRYPPEARAKVAERIAAFLPE